MNLDHFWIRNEIREIQHKVACGSVRSSLSTLALLVTVGSEAVETKEPRSQGRGESREAFSEAASIAAVWGPGCRKGPTYVNCYRHRPYQGAKDADRLRPKWRYSRLFPRRRGTHGRERLSVYEAGTPSFVLLIGNKVNPSSRLSFLAEEKAGVAVRYAGGVQGKGRWKKRMLSCNGADKGCNITPPCKWADFRLVMMDEIVWRTFTGGNAN